MKLVTVSADLGCTIDEAQKALDQDLVRFDPKTGRYYLRSKESLDVLISRLNGRETILKISLEKMTITDYNSLMRVQHDCIELSKVITDILDQVNQK